jgi:hypothetical protein
VGGQSDGGVWEAVRTVMKKGRCNAVVSGKGSHGVKKKKPMKMEVAVELCVTLCC